MTAAQSLGHKQYRANLRSTKHRQLKIILQIFSRQSQTTILQLGYLHHGSLGTKLKNTLTAKGGRNHKHGEDCYRQQGSASQGGQCCGGERQQTWVGGNMQKLLGSVVQVAH